MMPDGGSESSGTEPDLGQRCTQLKELAGSLAASLTMATAIGGCAGDLESAQRELERSLRDLAAAQAHLDAHVVAAQKQQVQAVVVTGKALRVNLGPGETLAQGWVNVDLAQGEVIADLRRPLPFPDGSVSHLYCSHVLEHLRNPDEAHTFLRECYRVLRRGGKLRVIVPDIAIYLRASLEHDEAFWATHQQTWPWSRVDANRLDQTLRYAGAGPNPSDFFGHQHGYNAESLVDVLQRAGFTPIKLSGFQQSNDEVFRIDDQSLVAHVEHDGQPLSLFAEACALF